MPGSAPRYTISLEDVRDPRRLLDVLQRLIAHDYDLLGQLGPPATQPGAITAAAPPPSDDLSGRVVSLEQLIAALLVGGTDSPVPAQRAAIPTVTALPPVASSAEGDTVMLGTSYYTFSSGVWVTSTGPSNMVTTDTAQNIVATKTFTVDQVFSGKITIASEIDVGTTKSLLKSGTDLALYPPASGGTLSMRDFADTQNNLRISDVGAMTLLGKLASYSGLATVGMGVPPVLGQLSLTGQTAALGSQTVYTTAAAGLYLLIFQLAITTAGTGGTISVDVYTTDRVGALTENTVGGNAATASNGRTRFAYPVRANSGTVIGVGTTFNGVTGTPAYALDAAVIRLV